MKATEQQFPVVVSEMQTSGDLKSGVTEVSSSSLDEVDPLPCETVRLNTSRLDKQKSKRALRKSSNGRHPK